MVTYELLPVFVERVWGSQDLEPYYPSRQQRIGEVWFDVETAQTREGPSVQELIETHGEDWLGRGAAAHRRDCCSLLVKFLFTTERLSVQVHPGDEYARQHEGSAGKAEMWHILECEPGARVAMGLHEPVAKQTLRIAAEQGHLEDLLEWIPVAPGDTFFIPPGTVHAIGGGIRLCEVQQSSNVTYRLYDYGRPRELHLDHGVHVADCRPYIAPPVVPHELPHARMLACNDHFSAELLTFTGGGEHGARPEQYQLLVVTAGAGLVDGRAVRAGQVLLLPAGNCRIAVEPRGSLTLVSAFPSESR